MNRNSYEENIKALRKKRDEKSAANSLGWINLAGLFWLEEGENSFGSDENNKIAMPGFPCPQCGFINFENGLVTLQPAQNVGITVNGKTPPPRPLQTDRDETPDLIEIGPLTMKFIIRGDATLLRIWDREAPVRKSFSGFKYYPVKPEYCVTAKYVRYSPAKPVKTLDMIGTETESLYLGQAEFSLNGTDCTLVAEKSGEKVLFHFDDHTKKDTTYGGGRKFTVPIPENDEIILDFNLAENWPCAYTPYATCPVTPMENRLSVRIEAGERKYFE